MQIHITVKDDNGVSRGTISFGGEHIELLREYLRCNEAKTKTLRVHKDSNAYKCREAIRKMLSDKPVGFRLNKRAVEIFFALNQINIGDQCISSTLRVLVSNGELGKTDRRNYFKTNKCEEVSGADVQ